MSRGYRPNMLVMMTDQHSRHFLGCYGNAVVRTPSMDRLAAGGMRFTDAYCAAPLCVPSRMSFMTTRTPGKNRVWANMHVLSSGIPTWAHALGAAGYETSLIGRMHFVGADHRHGFETRPIGEFSAVHPGVPRKGGDRWARFPSATSGQSRESVEIAGKGTTSYQWYDEQVTETACRYLREKARDRGGRPFAAVVGYVLPHCPFVAPAELFDYYYDRIDLPEVEERQPETVRRYRSHRGILDPPLPAERVRVALAAYDALCEYSDFLIGNVLDALEETGLDRDTLVVYTSDHGETAGEHGCWWKSNYYEGSAGVPLVCRLPGVVREGVSSGAVCNVMDLGATIIDLAGAQPLPNGDGRSLLPLLRDGEDAGWPDETFCELVDFRGETHPALPSRMIRSGQWKYWEFCDPDGLPPALFDLEADPGEVCDLGQESKYTDVRKMLSQRLHQGWNPEQAAAEALDGRACHNALAAWGREVMPECPDALSAPHPPVEADVVLL